MRGIERHWARRTLVSVVLSPLGLLYCLIAVLRYGAYRVGLLRSRRLPVPVIVIGNITVGGTGKTPLTVWLVDLLRRHGYRPGIVTRGYRGKASSWPQAVMADSDPRQVGDEPVLLARNAACPVVAAPDRVAAARMLVEQGCNLIVSDDGLQHYRLARDIEIAVIDGARRFGNGWCLPAGPLREPVARLGSVDFRIVQGEEAGAAEWGMRLVEDRFHRIGQASTPVTAGHFSGRRVHAVAGIGHPERFFDHLRRLGLDIVAHPFPDHHSFRADDLRFGDDAEIVMTEKDAVKCRLFPLSAWYLKVAAQPATGFDVELLRRIEEIRGG